MKRLISTLLVAAILLCVPVFAADETSEKPPYTTDVTFVKAVADVTGDGEVTSLDAATILRYDAGLVKSFVERDESGSVASEDDIIPLGDVNADGRITSLDAAFVLRYDAGLIIPPDEAPVVSESSDGEGDSESSVDIAIEETPDVDSSCDVTVGSTDAPSVKQYTVTDVGNGSIAVETEGTSTAINSETCVLITSVEELVAYAEGSDMGAGKDAFLAATAKYDEAYFKYGVIAVSAVIDLTPRTVLKVESVLCTEAGQLNIVVRIRRPAVYDLDYTYWHVVTEYNSPATSARLVRAGGTYFFPEGGLLEGAQNIRIHDPEERSETHLIKSREELDTYLADYPVTKDNGIYYSDSSMSLHRACKAYDGAFFEENYLVIVGAVRGSGSDEPFVLDSGVTEDGDVRVDYGWIIPEIGTADMAYWRLLIPVSREGVAEDAEVIKNSKGIGFGAYSYDAEYVKRWYLEYTVIYFDGEDGYEYCFADEKLYATLSSLDYNGEGTGISQYKIEFSGGVYHVNTAEGYVFCDKGRANLTNEQLEELTEAIEYAEYCAIAFGVKG